MGKWEDDTLLRLRREYSKDEVVAALSAKLSKRELEIGFLTSERDEAWAEIKKLKRSIKPKSEVKIIEQERDDAVAKLKEITALSESERNALNQDSLLQEVRQEKNRIKMEIYNLKNENKMFLEKLAKANLEILRLKSE